MADEIELSVHLDNKQALMSLTELEVKAGEMSESVQQMQSDMTAQLPGYAEGMTFQYSQFQDNLQRLIDLRRSIDTASNSFDADRLTESFTRSLKTIENVYKDFAENFQLSKTIESNLSGMGDAVKTNLLSSLRELQPELVGELRKFAASTTQAVGSQTDKSLLNMFADSDAFKKLQRQLTQRTSAFGGSDDASLHNLQALAKLSMPFAVAQYNRQQIVDWFDKTNAPETFRQMLPKSFQTIPAYLKITQLRQRGSNAAENRHLTNDEKKALESIVASDTFALDAAVSQGIARKHNGRIFLNEYTTREMINAMAGRVMHDIVNGAQGEARYGITDVEDPDVFYKIIRKNNKMLTGSLQTARMMNDRFGSWLNPGYYEAPKGRFSEGGKDLGTIRFAPRIDTRAFAEYTLDEMKRGAQYDGQPVTVEGQPVRPEDYHQITLRDSIHHRKLRATQAGDNVEHNGFSRNAIYLKTPEEAYDYETSPERLKEIEKDLAERIEKGYTVNGRHYSYVRHNATHAEFVLDDIIKELGGGDFEKGRDVFLNGAKKQYTDPVKFHKALDYQNKTATDSQRIADLYGSDLRNAKVVVSNLKELGMDGFNLISDEIVPASFQGRENEAAEKATYVKFNMAGLRKLYKDKIDSQGNLVIPKAAPGGQDLVIGPDVTMIEDQANIKNFDSLYRDKDGNLLPLEAINAARSKVMQRGDLSAKVTYEGANTDKRWLSHQMVQTLGPVFTPKLRQYFMQNVFDELASLGDDETVRRKLFGGQNIDLNTPAAQQTIQDYRDSIFERISQGDLLGPEGGIQYGMAAPWVPSIVNKALKRARVSLTKEQESAAIDENNVLFMNMLADTLGIVRAPYSAEGNIVAGNEAVKDNFKALVKTLGLDPNGLYMAPGAPMLSFMQTEDFDGDINAIMDLSSQGVSRSDPRFAAAMNKLMTDAQTWHQKNIIKESGRTQEEQEALKAQRTIQAANQPGAVFDMFDSKTNAHEIIEGAQAGQKMGLANAVDRNAWQYGVSQRVARAHRDSASHYDAVSTFLKERNNFDLTEDERKILSGGAPFAAMFKWINDAMEDVDGNRMWTENSQAQFNKHNIDKVNLPSRNQGDIQAALYTRFLAAKHGFNINGKLNLDEVFAKLPEVDLNTATGRMTQQLRNIRRDMGKGLYVALSDSLAEETKLMSTMAYNEITRDVNQDSNFITTSDKNKEIARRFREAGGEVAKNIDQFVVTESIARNNQDLSNELKQLSDLSGQQPVFGKSYGTTFKEPEKVIEQNKRELERIDKENQEKQHRVDEIKATQANTGRRLITDAEYIVYDPNLTKDEYIKNRTETLKLQGASPETIDADIKSIAQLYDDIEAGRIVVDDRKNSKFKVKENGQWVDLSPDEVETLKQLKVLTNDIDSNNDRKAAIEQNTALAENQLSAAYNFIKAQERFNGIRSNVGQFTSGLYSSIAKKENELEGLSKAEIYYNDKWNMANRLYKELDAFRESQEFAALSIDDQSAINNWLSKDNGLFALVDKDLAETTAFKSQRVLEQYQKRNVKHNGNAAILEDRFKDYDKDIENLIGYRDLLQKRLAAGGLDDKTRDLFERRLAESNKNITATQKEIGQLKTSEVTEALDKIKSTVINDPFQKLKQGAKEAKNQVTALNDLLVKVYKDQGLSDAEIQKKVENYSTLTQQIDENAAFQKDSLDLQQRSRVRQILGTYSNDVDGYDLERQKAFLDFRQEQSRVSKKYNSGKFITDDERRLLNTSFAEFNRRFDEQHLDVSSYLTGEDAVRHKASVNVENANKIIERIRKSHLSREEKNNRIQTIQDLFGDDYIDQQVSAYQAAQERKADQMRLRDEQQSLQAERYARQGDAQLRNWNYRNVTSIEGRAMLQRRSMYDQLIDRRDQSDLQIRQLEAKKKEIEAALANPKTENKDQLKSSLASTEQDIAKYTNSLNQAKEALNQFGSNEQFSEGMNAVKATLESVGKAADQVVKRFATQLFRQAFREAKTFVTQFSTQMQNIQAITLKTDEEMSKVRADTIQRAIDLRTSVSNVATVEADLYRQGLSDEQVEARTGAIIKFATVTGAKVTDAGKAITTAIQNGLVNSAQEAMDVLTALGDTAATTANEIFKGMQKAAAAAKVAGVSYKELTTLLTIGTSKTQLSGQVIGTGLQTIFSRMNRVTNEGYYNDETGATTTINDVEKALQNAGVQLRESTNREKFRNSFDVLMDLSAVWNDLTDLQRSNITYTMAGGRQTNMFQSLMEGLAEDGGAEARRLLGVASNSEGTTDAKYAQSIRSVTAAMDELKSTFDGLVESLSSNNIIVGTIDAISAITEGLRGLSSTGSALPQVIVTVGAALAAFAVKALFASQAVSNSLGGFSGLLGTLSMIGTVLTIGNIGSIWGSSEQQKANAANPEYQQKQAEEKANKFYETQKSRLQPVQDQIDEVKRLGQAWDEADSNMKDEAAKGLRTSLESLRATLRYLGIDFKDSASNIQNWANVVTEAQDKVTGLTLASAKQADDVKSIGVVREIANIYEQYESMQTLLSEGLGKYFGQHDIIKEDRFANLTPTDVLFNHPYQSYRNMGSFVDFVTTYGQGIATQGLSNRSFADMTQDDLDQLAKYFGENTDTDGYQALYSAFEQSFKTGEQWDLSKFRSQDEQAAFIDRLETMNLGSLYTHYTNGQWDAEKLKQYSWFTPVNELFNGVSSGEGLTDFNVALAGHGVANIQGSSFTANDLYNIGSALKDFSGKYAEGISGLDAFKNNVENVARTTLMNSSQLGYIFGNDTAAIKTVVDRAMSNFQAEAYKDNAQGLANYIQNMQTELVNTYAAAKDKNPEWLERTLHPENYQTQIEYLNEQGQKVKFGINQEVDPENKELIEQLINQYETEQEGLKSDAQVISDSNSQLINSLDSLAKTFNSLVQALSGKTPAEIVSSLTDFANDTNSGEGGGGRSSSRAVVNVGTSDQAGGFNLPAGAAVSASVYSYVPNEGAAEEQTEDKQVADTLPRHLPPLEEYPPYRQAYDKYTAAYQHYMETGENGQAYIDAGKEVEEAKKAYDAEVAKWEEAAAPYSQEQVGLSYDELLLYEKMMSGIDDEFEAPLLAELNHNDEYLMNMPLSDEERDELNKRNEKIVTEIEKNRAKNRDEWLKTPDGQRLHEAYLKLQQVQAGQNDMITGALGQVWHSAVGAVGGLGSDFMTNLSYNIANNEDLYTAIRGQLMLDPEWFSKSEQEIEAEIARRSAKAADPYLNVAKDIDAFVAGHGEASKLDAERLKEGYFKIASAYWTDQNTFDAFNDTERIGSYLDWLNENVFQATGYNLGHNLPMFAAALLTHGASAPGFLGSTFGNPVFWTSFGTDYSAKRAHRLKMADEGKAEPLTQVDDYMMLANSFLNAIVETASVGGTSGLESYLTGNSDAIPSFLRDVLEELIQGSNDTTFKWGSDKLQGRKLKQTFDQMLFQGDTILNPNWAADTALKSAIVSAGMTGMMTPQKIASQVRRDYHIRNTVDQAMAADALQTQEDIDTTTTTPAQEDIDSTTTAPTQEEIDAIAAKKKAEIEEAERQARQKATDDLKAQAALEYEQKEADRQAAALIEEQQKVAAEAAQQQQQTETQANLENEGKVQKRQNNAQKNQSKYQKRQQAIAQRKQQFQEAIQNIWFGDLVRMYQDAGTRRSVTQQKAALAEIEGRIKTATSGNISKWLEMDNLPANVREMIQARSDADATALQKQQEAEILQLFDSMVEQTPEIRDGAEMTDLENQMAKIDFSTLSDEALAAMEERYRNANGRGKRIVPGILKKIQEARHNKTLSSEQQPAPARAVAPQVEQQTAPQVEQQQVVEDQTNAPQISKTQEQVNNLLNVLRGDKFDQLVEKFNSEEARLDPETQQRIADEIKDRIPKMTPQEAQQWLNAKMNLPEGVINELQQQASLQLDEHNGTPTEKVVDGTPPAKTVVQDQQIHTGVQEQTQQATEATQPKPVQDNDLGTAEEATVGGHIVSEPPAVQSNTVDQETNKQGGRKLGKVGKAFVGFSLNSIATGLISSLVTQNLIKGIGNGTSGEPTPEPISLAEYTHVPERPAGSETSEEPKKPLTRAQSATVTSSDKATLKSVIDAANQRQTQGDTYSKALSLWNYASQANSIEELNNLIKDPQYYAQVFEDAELAKIGNDQQKYSYQAFLDRLQTVVFGKTLDTKIPEVIGSTFDFNRIQEAINKIEGGTTEEEYYQAIASMFNTDTNAVRMNASDYVKRARQQQGITQRGYEQDASILMSEMMKTYMDNMDGVQKGLINELSKGSPEFAFEVLKDSYLGSLSEENRGIAESLFNSYKSSGYTFGYSNGQFTSRLTPFLNPKEDLLNPYQRNLGKAQAFSNLAAYLDMYDENGQLKEGAQQPELSPEQIKNMKSYSSEFAQFVDLSDEARQSSEGLRLLEQMRINVAVSGLDDLAELGIISQEVLTTSEQLQKQGVVQFDAMATIRQKNNERSQLIAAYASSNRTPEMDQLIAGRLGYGNVSEYYADKNNADAELAKLVEATRSQMENDFTTWYNEATTDTQREMIQREAERFGATSKTDAEGKATFSLGKNFYQNVKYSTENPMDTYQRNLTSQEQLSYIQNILDAGSNARAAFDKLKGPVQNQLMNVSGLADYMATLGQNTEAAAKAQQTLARTILTMTVQALEEEGKVLSGLSGQLDTIINGNIVDSVKQANALNAELTNVANGMAAYQRLTTGKGTKQASDWDAAQALFGFSDETKAKYISGERSLQADYGDLQDQYEEYLEQNSLTAAEQLLRDQYGQGKAGLFGSSFFGRNKYKTTEDIIESMTPEQVDAFNQQNAYTGAQIEDGKLVYKANLADAQMTLSQRMQRNLDARNNVADEARQTEDYRLAYNVATLLTGKGSDLNYVINTLSGMQQSGIFNSNAMQNLFDSDEFVTAVHDNDRNAFLNLLQNGAYGVTAERHRINDEDVQKYLEAAINGNVDILNGLSPDSSLYQYLMGIDGFSELYAAVTGGRTPEAYQKNALISSIAIEQLRNKEQNKDVLSGTSQLASTALTGTKSEVIQAFSTQATNLQNNLAAQRLVDNMMKNTEEIGELQWESLEAYGIDSEQIKYYRNNVDQLETLRSDLESEGNLMMQSLNEIFTTINASALTDDAKEVIKSMLESLFDMSGVKIETDEKGNRTYTQTTGYDSSSAQLLAIANQTSGFTSSQEIKEYQNQLTDMIRQSANYDAFQQLWDTEAKPDTWMTDETVLKRVLGDDFGRNIAMMEAGVISWDDFTNRMTQSSGYGSLNKDTAFEDYSSVLRTYAGDNFENGEFNYDVEGFRQFIAENGDTTGFVDWMQNLEYGSEVLQHFGEDSEEATGYMNKFIASFKESARNNAKEWGEDTADISENVKSLGRNARTTATTVGSLITRMTKLNDQSFAASKARGKTGAQLDQQTRGILASAMGLDESALKKMSKAEIEGLADMVENSANEEFSAVGNIVAEKFEEVVNQHLADKDITISQAVKFDLNGDGQLDFSEIEAACRAMSEEELATLAGFAGEIATLTAKYTQNGQQITVENVLTSLLGGKGGGYRGGSGGGGGGGKSAAQKLLEDIKREKQLRDHEIKMIQYQETKYANAGELGNENRMIELENEAQKRLIQTLEEAIKKTKEQMSQTKKGTDDWYSLYESVLQYEEGIEEATQAIQDNIEKMKENEKEILKMHTALEQSVLEEIETRKQMERDMLAGSVSMQDMIVEAIRERYRKEWELVKQDIDKKRQALEEEKSLIDERLQRRKDAEDEAEKYEELSEYKKQLALISMDSTRTKDAAKLREQISKLEKEMAWDAAEDEAEYQKEQIDDQIQAYDDFVQYGEEDLEDWLSDANNFVEEVDDVLKMSQEALMQWLKENMEEYGLALDDAQKQMIQGWTDTYEQMLGITHTYWEEIAAILSGKDTWLAYMKQSREYIDASEDERTLMLQDWEEMYDDWLAAQKRDAVYEHRDDELSGVGQESTKGSGGGGGSTKQKATVDTGKAGWGFGALSIETTVTPLTSMPLSTTVDEPRSKSQWVQLGRYANGGLVDYTGPAWVDGTPMKPEAFLSAEDTALIRGFLDEAKYVRYRSSVSNIDSASFDSNAQNIGELIINITEAQFKEDADYEEVAKRVGQQFVKELSKQGFHTMSYSF